MEPPKRNERNPLRRHVERAARINLRLIHTGKKRRDVKKLLHGLKLKEVTYDVSDARLLTFGTVFCIDDPGQRPQRAISAILALWIDSKEPSHYICFDCDPTSTPHQCFFEQAVKNFIDEFDKLDLSGSKSRSDS
jgi:hypothetical protein